MSSADADHLRSRTQRERSDATRTALMAAARRLFAERGYSGVPAEVIVRTAGMDAGAIQRQPVRALAHVLLGALDEAVLLLARADDPASAREEVAGVLDALIEGMRTPAS